MTTPTYFLHIPKTAGTTLISYLDSQFIRAETCPAQDLPSLFATAHAELASFNFFRGHLWFGLPAYVGRPLQCMTVLRDPLLRTLSWYAHAKRDPGAYRHERMNKENWSVHRFVTDQETNWDLVNAQTIFIAADLDYAKLAADPVGYGQARIREYAQNGNPAELLALAKSRLEKFVCIGITERLQESMNLMSYAMRLNPNLARIRLNTFNSQRELPSLTTETIDAIRSATMLDQQLYDWANARLTEQLLEMQADLISQHCEKHPRPTSSEHFGPLPATGVKGFEILVEESPTQIRPSETFLLPVSIHNNNACAVSSDSPYPVSISYHWLDESGSEMIAFEGSRTRLEKRLYGMSSTSQPASITAPPVPGRYTLRMTLVQESVAWFDSEGIYHDKHFVVVE